MNSPNRRANSILWNFFTLDGSKVKASCNVCQEVYSFFTTNNLKSHLRNKHPDVCPMVWSSSTNEEKISTRACRSRNSLVWGYFKRLHGPRKMANCRICSKELSYATTVTNLKSHLKQKHPNAYDRLQKKLPLRESSGTNSSDEDDNAEKDLPSPQKLKDLWTYFEQEDSKARCVVCRLLLDDTDYDNLKGHMFSNHPKLLLQLMQDQDEKEETKSDGPTETEDNGYTEVVYLEQDSAQEDSMPIGNIQPKLINTYTHKRNKKRHRNSSSSDPFITLKQEKEQNNEQEKLEDNSELETFIKYITCLLKKLSPTAFSKVQVEILKTIMDAQYSSNITVTDSSSSILTEIAAGNVSKVIRLSEMQQDNAALLGNYTITLASKSEDHQTK